VIAAMAAGSVVSTQNSGSFYGADEVTESRNGLIPSVPEYPGRTRW